MFHVKHPTQRTSGARGPPGRQGHRKGVDMGWTIQRIEGAGLQPAPVTCNVRHHPVKVTLYNTETRETAVTWACLNEDITVNPCDPEEMFDQLQDAGFVPNDFGCG